MKKIIITSPKYGTHEVLVDEEDFDLLSKYKWGVVSLKGNIYASTCITRVNKVLMHRMIMGLSGKKMKKIIVDHIDHNTINNQKNNLRKCSTAQNCRNSKLSKNSTTKYKGVYFNKKIKRYQVFITINRKHISGGPSFTSKNAAAERYNELAVIHHGEFAKLNVIQNE